MTRYGSAWNGSTSSVDGQRPGNSVRPQRPAAVEYFVSAPQLHSGNLADLKPDTRLLDGRFTIRRQLGAGASGAVYLAYDALRGQEVALKVVVPALGSPDLAYEQLQQEIMVHASIRDYQHVIKVHDIHRSPWGGLSLLILSMEYADGGDLRGWLVHCREDRARRGTEGLSLFKQASMGIAALHAAGIRHLDLKPENLLRCGPMLKVADFGAAAMARALARLNLDSEPALPVDVCTPTYMSPEHFLARCWDDLDERADIYALGLILYEILDPRGRPPFAGSAQRLREFHLEMPPPPLTGLTPAQQRVISKCLAKTPADRYSQIADMLADLESPDTPPGDAPVVGQVNTADLEHLWNRACRCVEQREFGEATGLCRAILNACPAHHDAERLLAQLQARYEQAAHFYATIERALDDRPLTELVSLVREAVEIYPDHPSGRLVQTQLVARAQEYRDKMRQGIQNMQEGLWEPALSCFRRVQQINSSAAHVATAIEFIRQVQQRAELLRGHIDTAIQQRDRRRAMSLARLLDGYIQQAQLSVRSS